MEKDGGSIAARSSAYGCPRVLNIAHALCMSLFVAFESISIAECISKPLLTTRKKISSDR